MLEVIDAFGNVLCEHENTPLIAKLFVDYPTAKYILEVGTNVMYHRNASHINKKICEYLKVIS